jgi:hypothetical protein
MDDIEMETEQSGHIEIRIDNITVIPGEGELILRLGRDDTGCHRFSE